MAISVNEQIVLNSSYTGSEALMDVQFIKGAFKVFATYDEMTDAPIASISDNQIVWVESLEELYQATVTLANPPISFSDSVSWSTFTGFGSGGGGFELGLGHAPRISQKCLMVTEASPKASDSRSDALSCSRCSRMCGG